MFKDKVKKFFFCVKQQTGSVETNALTVLKSSIKLLR